MFAPQWTLKGEYLYYDLGPMSTALPQQPFFGANVISSTIVKSSIARVGVNTPFYRSIDSYIFVLFA